MNGTCVSGNICFDHLHCRLKVHSLKVATVGKRYLPRVQQSDKRSFMVCAFPEQIVFAGMESLNEFFFDEFTDRAMKTLKYNNLNFTLT